jgi:heme-degrading monooxygenase HmoA
MAEHAGLIQMTTFQAAPGRRDELLALCAEIQERAATADGCFGAQTCTVNDDPDAVVAISGGATGTAWTHSRLPREVAPRSGSAMC